MKNTLLNTVLILVFISVMLMAMRCGRATGDNKKATVDNAPKPELASYSIRKDVPPVYTNDFIGNLQLIERTLYDTIEYNISVKGSKVRIDVNIHSENNESSIIDLKENQMIVLNHKKKLYSIMPLIVENTLYDSAYKIVKTNNEKVILGVKCKQWRVKNVKDNTEITFWVGDNKYGFYHYLIKGWLSSIKPHKYFQIIPESFGFMPFEIVERNLLRDFKSSFNITKITFGDVSNDSFEVPKTYSLYTI